VKLNDITGALKISLGNLTYYYKTKKDLIAAIINYMSEDRLEVSVKSGDYLKDNNWMDLIKGYLLFQLKYAFFYRDVLDLYALNKEAKSLCKNEINSVILFIKNSIDSAIDKGYLISEPRESLYDGLAHNVWSIIQSWFIKRAVFGSDSADLNEPFLFIMNLYYPYATRNGLDILDHLSARKNMLV
jgi:AcrR family transcriptional regulator